MEEEQLKSRDVSVICVSRDQLVVGGDRVFRFDRVFPPSAGQVRLFVHNPTPLFCVSTSSSSSSLSSSSSSYLPVGGGL